MSLVNENEMDLAGEGHQHVMLVFSMLMLVFTTMLQEKRNMSHINKNEIYLAGEGHQHVNAGLQDVNTGLQHFNAGLHNPARRKKRKKSLVNE